MLQGGSVAKFISQVKIITVQLFYAISLDHLRAKGCLARLIRGCYFSYSLRNRLPAKLLVLFYFFIGVLSQRLNEPLFLLCAYLALISLLSLQTQFKRVLAFQVVDTGWHTVFVVYFSNRVQLVKLAVTVNHGQLECNLLRR